MANHDDPDAALERVRRYVDFLGKSRASQIRATDVYKFAADVQYLDEQISRGGALPVQWSELWVEPVLEPRSTNDIPVEFGGM